MLLIIIKLMMIRVIAMECIENNVRVNETDDGDVGKLNPRPDEIELSRDGSDNDGVVGEEG